MHQYKSNMCNYVHVHRVGNHISSIVNQTNMHALTTVTGETMFMLGWYPSAEPMMSRQKQHWTDVKSDDKCINVPLCRKLFLSLVWDSSASGEERNQLELWVGIEEESAHRSEWKYLSNQNGECRWKRPPTCGRDFSGLFTASSPMHVFIALSLVFISCLNKS